MRDHVTHVGSRPGPGGSHRDARRHSVVEALTNDKTHYAIRPVSQEHIAPPMPDQGIGESYHTVGANAV